MGREGQESPAEEDHGGVGDRGHQGTDRPQTALRSQRPRLHGRQDQSGEAAGEKYFLRKCYKLSINYCDLLHS